MKILCALFAACALLAGVCVAASQPPLTGGSGPRRPTFRAGGGRTGGGEEKPTETPAAPAPAGFSDALDLLSQIRRTAAVRSMAGRGWQVGPDGTAECLIWVAGELDPVVAVKDERWEDGGNVTVELEAPDGTWLEKQTQALDRDTRFFSIRFLHTRGFSPGGYSVRVTATPEARPSGTVETLSVSVPSSSDVAPPGLAGEPRLMRRGPFSGADWMPTGDARYHRQERVKVETTVAGAVETSGVRLLDRAAHPLPLPASSAAHFERGITTVSGELALAPLSAGDYVLETTVTRGALTERRYTAIRIVP